MAEEVKDASRAPPARGISRHLEGWQPGLVAVATALLGALLGVPRSVAPQVLPLPKVDVREMARAEESSRELARQALREPLPFEVRAVGEAFRRFGAANAAQNTGLAQDHLVEVRTLARGALELHGEGALERLQALQTQMFLELTVRWERGEDVDAALGELGGNFVDKAKSAGWLSGARRLVLSEAERRVLFKVRWADVTGLRDRPRLAPTANDWRLYYRFLLLHPEQSVSEAHAKSEAMKRGGGTEPRSREGAKRPKSEAMKRGGGTEPRSRESEQQLRVVSLIERVDPSYPGAFARGVLYYRLGAYAQAEAAFRGYLSETPSGPWRLRARNHLVAAGERAREGAEPSFE